MENRNWEVAAESERTDSSWVCEDESFCRWRRWGERFWPYWGKKKTGESGGETPQVELETSFYFAKGEKTS